MTSPREEVTPQKKAKRKLAPLLEDNEEQLEQSPSKKQKKDFKKKDQKQ